MDQNQIYPEKYTLMVPANLAFSSIIRKTAEDVFLFAGLNPSEVFRLVLVVDELFMNAVRHGSLENASVHLQLYWQKGKRILVEIEDEGGKNGTTPADLEAKIQMEFQRHSPEKKSGRGLAQITLHLTDEFHVNKSQYGGIKISFEKKL